LQLREELLKQDKGVVKSKFLAKFMHRDEILKLVVQESLCASFPENGQPVHNDMTTLVVQLISMMITAGSIDERAKIGSYMHS
jgi:hypothetical protein